MLIGQLAVMANGLIDTVMAGRLSATDLAAVGLAGSIQITVYISLMALGPIIGQHYGAQRYTEIGKTFQQGLLVACLLSIIGACLLFANPFWLGLIDAPAPVASIASRYLNWSALGIGAALLFRVFYATSSAVNLPRNVMLIQLFMLVFKIPLNWLFMYGTSWGLPAMGGAGCGLATAVLAWVGFFCAVLTMRVDIRYKPFAIQFWQSWDRKVMAEVLRLGIPIGLSYGIEITSFTVIAMLIAHQGVTVAAAHQITSNLLGLAYMPPLALSSAVSTLVAQQIGARDFQQAKKAGWLGIRVVMSGSLLIAFTYGWFGDSLARLYLTDQAELESVLTLAQQLIRILAVFVIFDALQTVLAFILRAHKIATVPTVIYAASLWGVGIGGGWWLTHSVKPAWGLGAAGYWWAGALGVLIAGIAFAVLVRQQWNRVPGQDLSPAVHV
jgi:multidrug resistance protein, MATE family